MIAGDLKLYLSNVASLTPLIGTGDEARVFHNRSRQSRVPPFLVLEQDFGEVAPILNGDSGLVQTTFVIFHYAKTRDEADELADLVRIAWNTFAGLLGGTYIVEVSMPQYMSTRTIRPQDGSEGFLFEARQLYDTWFHVTPAAPPAPV
jgi:hypothetical protein